MRSFVDRHKFLKNNPSDVVRAYGLPKPVEEERGMKCSVIWLVLWNGVSDAFFVVSPRLRQHPVSLQHLMAASSVQSQEDEPAIDLNEVSDVEALLACRAYLQRKNRLGSWTQGQERRAKREDRAARRAFFWAIRDQDELSTNIFYRDDAEEEVDFDEVAAMYQEVPEAIADRDEVEDEEENRQQSLGLFTALPTGPSERSEIRSKVKKAQWRDPDFRDRWYRSRWGKHTKSSEAERKQEQQKFKLERIPTSVLESPEFLSLTQEEITDAIESYVKSNQKRAASLKRTRKSRELQTEPDKQFPRDALFSVSEEELRERQRKRSERAKKAYKSRISNATGKEASVAKTRPKRTLIWRPKGPSSNEALIRITADLDTDRMPASKDVELMLKPVKMSRRKQVLCRILAEKFGKRGKCVPTDDGEVYVTQASLPELGHFVVELLRQEESVGDRAR
jgi:hypothetical protein